MGRLRQDLGLGLRLLARNPGFAGIAVLTLALGIAASAVIFSVVHAVFLVLAATGVYGVTSFAVARRTREFGLRMALGAGRGRLLGSVLRQGLGDAVLGMALGAAGAWYATRALRGILYGVENAGSLPFVAVALVLLAAAALACLVPALRAAAVDPMQALRQE